MTEQEKRELRERGFYPLEEFQAKERLLSEKVACLEKQLDKIPRWIKSIFR